MNGDGPAADERRAGAGLRERDQARRFDALHLMQAMQLGHAVAALHALRVTDALHDYRSVVDLALEFRLDEAMLAGLLDHAARATSLVQRRGHRYRMSKAWNDEARFLIGLYGSAFGACAADVRSQLRRPGRSAGLVDRAMHARAFAERLSTGPATADVAVVSLLRQLGARRVVDVGCGPAALLIELARGDASFHGWGIEANADMLAAARATARQQGVSARVTLVDGDALDVRTSMRDERLRQVRVIVASQFINEMFGAGTDAAVTWLRDLGQLLPERLLVVADYYGRLGSSLAAQEALTLVHDHAQLTSGQGIPPARRSGWIALYTAAGARMIHAVEDIWTTRFIHVVMLPRSVEKASQGSSRATKADED